jgi:small-conductance mechanosensitive channel
MQGVQNFGNYGIELRIKMKTKPGEQFPMKRRAYVLIKKAFDEAGITLPLPTVQVREAGSNAAAASLVKELEAQQPAGELQNS